jgi:Dolichyl-phosphate-mannose-protein mannosyltransferase/PA14 domain
MSSRLGHLGIRRVLVGALCVSAAWILAVRVFGTPVGVTRTIYRAPAFTGDVAHRDVVSDIDLRFTLKPHGPRRFFSARWAGVWYVDRAGTFDLSLGADDRAVLRIDRETVIERDPTIGFWTMTASRELTAGPHAIEVEYEQAGGQWFLSVGWAPRGEPARPFGNGRLFPTAPTPRQVRINAWLDAASYGVTALWLLVFSLVARSVAGRVRGAVRQHREGWSGFVMARWLALRAHTWWLAPVAAVFIVILGAALRFETICAMFGPFEQPVWLNELEAHTRERIAWLRRVPFHLEPVEQPYVGSDPINYLRFGREMTSFYAAHVREPLFPFATKLWLGPLQNHDVAVSFASASFSTLAIAATYLLGAYAFSRAVGLGAALGFAIEREAVAWAAQGWRDDAMTCLFVVSCYGFLRCRRHPSMMNAIVAGIVGGLACLTRITALSFLLPAVVLVGWSGRHGASREELPTQRIPDARRGPWRAAAISLLVMTAVVAPYLVNCAIVFGDPFHAINAHTKFYRARAGLPFKQPMGVGAYLGAGMRRDPLGLIGTGVQGLTSYPFLNKWNGFEYWVTGLGRMLRLLSLVGLIGFVGSPNGRFLLVLLIASLVPYAFTWHIPGGDEYRFTLHAYPIYLIAAMLAIERLVGLIGLARIAKKPVLSPPIGKGA